jgi:hypothetical protein
LPVQGLIEDLSGDRADRIRREDQAPIPTSCHFNGFPPGELRGVDRRRFLRFRWRLLDPRRVDLEEIPGLLE